MRIDYSPTESNSDNSTLAALLGCTITRRTPTATSIVTAPPSKSNTAPKAVVDVPPQMKDYSENENVPSSDKTDSQTPISKGFL